MELGLNMDGLQCTDVHGFRLECCLFVLGVFPDSVQTLEVLTRSSGEYEYKGPLGSFLSP